MKAMQHTLRLVLLLTISLLSLLPAVAESDADRWTPYFAYADATSIVEADGRCYALMNGNLMSYDPQTTEVRCYDSFNSDLTSKGIVLMEYSHARRVLVLVYSNGDIDLFDVRTEHVLNIPYYKSAPGSSPQLNNLNVQDDDAFLCTGEGVVWISLKRGVIMGQYSLGSVRAAGLYDGHLYAALAQGGVLRVSLDGNPLDISSWEEFSTFDVYDICCAFESLYFAAPYYSSDTDRAKTGLWRYDGESMSRLSSTSCATLSRSERYIVTWQSTTYLLIRRSEPWKCTQIIYGGPQFTTLYCTQGETYWGILPDEGIVHGTCQDMTFIPDLTGIKGDGPAFEHPYVLTAAGDDLFVLGGMHDEFDSNHYPYNVARLDANGEWHTLETPVADGRWTHRRQVFQDATSIAVDPRDASHRFVTTFRNGVFEYRGDALVAQYTLDNSPIKTASSSGNPDYVRTGSAIFDAQGNLFISNTSVETPILCLTPQGNWIPFNIPAIKYANCLGASLIDRKGRLWVCQYSSNKGLDAGFLCLDYNGTPSNPADDVYTYRSSFINQDGSAISILITYCIAEDYDGRLWLGTNNGLFVVDDPDRWSDSDFLITQVKVPRNDGTNYADYLLSGATITAITVDGANRKWIGTNGDGVYVVSPDGTVILHHFLTTDSPLVSDIIWSLASNPSTGEVFIGTDKGLVSYQSRTSAPADELSKDNVRIYPNPLRPDYNGVVTIEGLVADSEVKIVSLSGHVVADGMSQGGTFQWDGRGYEGQRVGSGVYQVMMTAPDGRPTIVAKLAVVR